MRGETLQREGKPALAHCRVNEADINAFLFQNRPLFDMHFVAGVEREGGGRTLPAIADSLQRRANADAVAIFAGEGERLTLGHFAQDRTIFARGAVRAALWLAETFGLIAAGAYLLSGAICTLVALWLNRELARSSSDKDRAKAA